MKELDASKPIVGHRGFNKQRVVFTKKEALALADFRVSAAAQAKYFVHLQDVVFCITNVLFTCGN